MPNAASSHLGWIELIEIKERHSSCHHHYPETSAWPSPIEGHYLPLSGMAATLTAGGLEMLPPGGLRLTKNSLLGTIFVA